MQPAVVPARGGTWLQAAHAQAARLAVRHALQLHVPACSPCSVQAFSQPMLPV